MLKVLTDEVYTQKCLDITDLVSEFPVVEAGLLFLWGTSNCAPFFYKTNKQNLKTSEA